jgi:hypothetical protein
MLIPRSYDQNLHYITSSTAGERDRMPIQPHRIAAYKKLNQIPNCKSDCGFRLVQARRDGRHILEPMVCSVRGSRATYLDNFTAEEIKELHNEGSRVADVYPLRAKDGLFFSESLSDLNPDFERYQQLVQQSIDVLISIPHVLSIRELEECGKRIQALDADFASLLIGKPLDSLHSCVGPDPSHQYSKITICRTTFPVDIGGCRLSFFFEKFLVAYSYIDAEGHRRSTQTPIHSHPMNFETVYFSSFGPGSHALEQEFFLLNEHGDSVIGPDGSIDEKFLLRMGADADLRPRLSPGPVSKILPGPGPIRLNAFDSELVLRNYHRLVAATDGLFRPHQVTVIDDSTIETRYFAIDNYFGPVGRVLLYAADGSVDLWSHDAWDH